MSLAIPCVIAWVLPTFLLGRMLPHKIDTEFITMPYRGDETRLNVWQRLLMLVVGIGGLWFIPTFHNITKLSPFLGAMCVLAVLWVVNEIVNRKLMKADVMIQQRVPGVLQYGVLQMMLYIMGIMLAIGVVTETGAASFLWHIIQGEIHNIWIYGLISGLISTVLDNFATAMTFISFTKVTPETQVALHNDFATNGAYWKIISYCVMVGGNVFAFSNMSGMALMKMERVHIGWYFRNVGWKTLLGGLLGLLALWIEI